MAFSQSSGASLFGGLHPSAVNVFPRSTAAAKPAPVLDLPALQSASQVLQDNLAKDAQLVLI